MGAATRRHERLVFLHGFTQTHYHWHRVAHAVAARLDAPPTLAFVDLPGHGLSSDDQIGIDGSAGPLSDAGGPGTYIGYSMGGRFGLVAALAGVEEVQRLVVIGATPGIDDATERAERGRLDGERADRIEHIGVDAFLDEWLAAPMFAGLPSDPTGLSRRRGNSAAGLASSLRLCGTANQGSLWHALGDVTIPMLVLAGERDDKFTRIGVRMAQAVPDASFVTVPDAGHAAHSEQPAVVADIIVDWLDRTSASVSRAPGRA